MCTQRACARVDPRRSPPITYACYRVHVTRLTRRTQILLDEERYRRLRERAAAEDSSVGAFVRAAIDKALAEPSESSLHAANAFLDAEPLPVGEPEDLGRELERAYAREGE